MQISRIVVFLVGAVLCSLLSLILLAVPNLEDKELSLKEKAKGLILNTPEKWRGLKPAEKGKRNYAIVMIVLTFFLAFYLCFQFEGYAAVRLLKRLALLSILWPAAYIDYKHTIIPNLYLIVGLGVWVIFVLLELIIYWNNLTVFTSILKDSGIAFVVTFIVLFIVRIIARSGLGFGDIKLVMLMGLFQGIVGVFQSIFIALLGSFFVSLFLLVTKRGKKNDSIPFGPFLLLGAYVGILLTGA